MALSADYCGSHLKYAKLLITLFKILTSPKFKDGTVFFRGEMAKIQMDGAPITQFQTTKSSTMI